MPEIQQAVEQQTEQRDNGGGRPWFIGCFSRTSADRDARMYGIYIYPCVNKRQIDTEGVHVLLMAKDGPTILRAVGGATYLRAVDDGTN